MDEFIKFLRSFGNLSLEDIVIIQDSFTEKSIKKGDFFSKTAQIPTEVGFIINGVIRGFYYDKHGTDITRCFIYDNQLVCDYINLESNKHSSESLQACEDCLLLVIEKKHWNSLTKKIPNWDIIKHKMIQFCLYQKSRKTPVISLSATTRYEQFLLDYPQLVNRIPLTYVASFLGVTPQSLSRIRKTK